eukprot:2924593-Amphidinium_carterae.1
MVHENKRNQATMKDLTMRLLGLSKFPSKTSKNLLSSHQTRRRARTAKRSTCIITPPSSTAHCHYTTQNHSIINSTTSQINITSSATTDMMEKALRVANQFCTSFLECFDLAAAFEL